MKILKLNFSKYNLGELTFDGEYYTFTLNKDSSKLLLKSGINFLATEKTKDVIIGKELPLVFRPFLPNEKDKLEMLESFDVLKTDSDFEKLLKIAKLNLNRDGFWLEV